MHTRQRVTFAPIFIGLALFLSPALLQLPLSGLGPSTINLSNDPAMSYDAHVAVSGTHVYVTWTTLGSDNLSDILFRSSPNNGLTWTPAINLSESSGKAFGSRVKAQGSDVYVFWVDTVTGGDEVYVKTSTDYGQTWGAAVDLSNTPTPSRHFRALVSGSVILVAWVDRLSRNNNVLLTISTNGGLTWSNATNLSNTVNDSENIRLGLYSNHIFVVWNAIIAGHFQVLYRESDDLGNTWLPTVNLSASTGDAEFPDLSVLVAGSQVNVYTTWQDNSTGTNEVYVDASHDAGATWAGPVQLSIGELAEGNSVLPAIGVQNVGTKSEVYVAWTYKSGTASSPYLSISSDGGNTFGTPLNLGSTAVSSSGIRLLVTSHTILAVWSDAAHGGKNTLLSNSTNFGGSFGSPDNLSAFMGSGSSQASFSDNSQGRGPVFVVWSGSSSGNGDIFLQRVASGVDTLNLGQLPVHLQEGS
jgi:hypothetical protein